jgi:hypothetical protein
VWYLHSTVSSSDNGESNVNLLEMSNEFCEDWGLTTETRNDLYERLHMLYKEAHNAALQNVIDRVKRERDTRVINQSWVVSIVELRKI